MDTIPAKTILTRVQKGGAWFGCDYNMNLYRGCCHGCIYCDSRSSCYGVEEFDTVRAKADALRILRDELRRKTRRGVVATGAMSDPYNPFERTEQLTRHALELLSAFGFGAAIATKSDLVVRDIDVLKEIQKFAPVLVKVTLTTTDAELAQMVEPHAPSPELRLAAARALADAGIFTGTLLMPVLPFLEDNEQNVLEVVRHAAKNGARFVFPAFGMTLRANQRMWYYAKLDEHFPGLSDAYRKRYGERYNCTSPNARRLWRIFSAECDRLGLLYRMSDIIRAYKMGCGPEQLSLLD